MNDNIKKISIIIPVFNEVETLEKLLAMVENVNLPYEKEIILIDDDSTDGSRELLQKYIEKHKVIFFDKNYGKGMAVKRGFKEASGDIILIQDADLEYNPNEYPALLAPIIDGKADVVYGSRFMKPFGDVVDPKYSRRAQDLRPEMSQFNEVIYKRGYLFSKALNFMSNVLNGVWLSDMYTCYKVFSRTAIKNIYPHLISKRFGIDPELTAWVAKLNFKIVEIPISYNGRTYEEGKKINWKDGLAAIWHIIRFNLFTRK